METITYLTGDRNILEKMPTEKAWKVFDSRAILFCDQLSKLIISDRRSSQYPDLVSLAFWLRKSNIAKLSQGYNDCFSNIGRGILFHIAPGNIALSFAYSLATGLLTGNSNIIRLPSKEFEQTNIVIEKINEIIRCEKEITNRICLINYPHNKSITDYLSMMCNARIIWGGNNTINEIRQSPLPPRTTEITFANRFSICVIDADYYLLGDAKKIAHSFYIDTYLTDQNACSSPRIVFWMGEDIDKAKTRFWEYLRQEVESYSMEAVTSVDKMLKFCLFASENLCSLRLEGDSKIYRVKIDTINKDIINYLGNSGFFYECDIAALEEILEICTLELQTISYIGNLKEMIHNLILDNCQEGIDRIVEVGHTLDFGFIWDGRDVVRELTRIVSFN